MVVSGGEGDEGNLKAGGSHAKAKRTDHHQREAASEFGTISMKEARCVLLLKPIFEMK